MPSRKLDPRPPKPKGEHNVLRQAVKSIWDLDFELRLDDGICITQEVLLAHTPSTYTVYAPMLLLPNHAFQDDCWTAVFHTDSDVKQRLWETIAEKAKVTHVAMNAFIPTPAYRSTADEEPTESPTGDSDNVLRRPTEIVPLYGNFGPHRAILTPSEEDFNDALWVTARQNGIVQTWAPLHTMFSRGNIKEKARILQLPSLQDQAEPITALDLYAGIGYFTFSYAKTGVAKVIGFELSVWSVEALRRGAEMNGWKAAIFTEADDLDRLAEDPRITDPKVKFLIFRMDNTKAGEVLQKLAGHLPPVRHINCGLLPSSSLSWETAVRNLDRKSGGWIHVHENLRLAVLDEEAERIRCRLEEIANDALEASDGQGQAGGRSRYYARLDHIEKVKSYAPGVMHVVLDIHVGPRGR